MINVKNKKLKKVKNSSSDDTKAGDQFDLILVDTELKKKKNGYFKREEKEQFLNTLITEMNNVIHWKYRYLWRYIDSWKNRTSFFTTLEYSSKRNVTDEEYKKEEKYTYVIFSLIDEALIYSYLSEELVPLLMIYQILKQ